MDKHLSRGSQSKVVGRARDACWLRKPGRRVLDPCVTSMKIQNEEKKLVQIHLCDFFLLLLLRGPYILIYLIY